MPYRNKEADSQFNNGTPDEGTLSPEKYTEAIVEDEAGGTDKTLEQHRSGAELDHPIGSIKIKHFDTSISAFLRHFIQMDDGTHFNADLVIGNSLVVENDLTIEGLTIFNDAVRINGIANSGLLTLNTNGHVGVNLRVNDISKGYFWWDNTNEIIGVGTGSIASSFIFKGGRVGFGVVPDATLTVSGDMKSTGNSYINNNSPTIYLQDLDHRSSMVHCNSNIFYILRGSGNNSTTWQQTGGGWPLTISLEDNTVTMAGTLQFVGNNRVIQNSGGWMMLRSTHANNHVYLDTHGSGLVRFRPGGTERAYVNANGLYGAVFN